MQFPEEQAQPSAIGDRGQLGIDRHLNVFGGGLGAQEEVFDRIHGHLPVFNHVAIQVEPAIGAGIHGGQGREEALEASQGFVLTLPWGHGTDQLGAGMHKPPGGGAEIVGETQSHLRAFDVIATQEDVDESNVFGEVATLAAKLLPFPPFLDPINVVMAQFPGLLEFLLDGQRAAEEVGL